jgi:PAS domain S-box-containing protein
MVSGISLLFALLNNLALLVATMVVYGALAFAPARLGKLARQIVLGLAFGIFALTCMYIKIPVADGVRVDQRNAVVALCGAFCSPFAALISGTIAALYRIYLGGQGVLSGVTGIGLSVLAGTILRRIGTPFGTIRRSVLSAFGATLLILPGFLLWGTWRDGVQLMLSMALPYGTAIGLAIFFGGILLERTNRQREAETTFRQMVAVAPEAIVVLDPTGRIQQFNSAAEVFSGIITRDAIGRRLVDLEWFDDADRAKLAQRLIDPNCSSERPIPFELRNKTGVRFFDSILVPLRTSIGEPAWMLSVHDVTARKRAEDTRADYEARILQSKSLEALGRLAGGVAHDFNNMLTVILATTELARSSNDVNSSQLEDLETIEDAAKRASQLTYQLLAFGRKQVVEPRVLNINSAISTLAPLLGRSIPENVELKLNCATNLPDVIVDASQFDQVLVNLVVNARDAMPNGGRIVITTANRVLSAEYCSKHVGVAPGRYVEISVTDTGEGMSQEVLDRVFEPFFTTKAPGKGTGLGLSSVHGMVQRSGGHIFASSVIGVGSTFSVYFPSTTQTQAPPSSEILIGPDTLTGHVLLVEDSDLVRMSIRKMLLAIGVEVTEAPGGQQAIAMYATLAKPITLILTDVIMRDMNGVQLVAELTKSDPMLKVLFMSGYTDEMIGHHGVLSPGVNFISKPFTIDELKTAIVRTIASPPNLNQPEVRF